LKDYRRALAYNDSSLAIRQKQNDKKGMATCYMNGADAWLQLKDYPRAFAGFQQALALGREINFMEAVIESYDGLSAWYEANGQPAEALRYYKLYKQSSDSVYNAGISQQIASLQTKYETGKKEQQLQQQQYELTRKNMWLWGGAVVVALLMALGYSSYRRLRLRKEKQLQEAVLKQQELATKAVMDAEENERRRIATELHDGVGQLMSAARMNLGAFESELNQLPPGKVQQFERIVQLVDESCREVRTVSHSMMPNALLKRGLAAAVRDFLDKIDSKILKVNLYTEGLDTRLDANTESMLYRIIQECVNNVIKHSGANQLDISLTREANGISLTVEDNGKGFDSSRREAMEGIGLKNIVSRVQVLKGEVDFDSQLGRGTLVAIYVPAGGSVV
nr:sensor histidine kinase [Chitinophagaceae bacterium]